MSIKKNQLALSNYPYFKFSFDYTFDSLQRLGAEAIELYCCDPHFHIDDAGLPEVMALKKKLKSRGLHPICLTPEQCKYPINIASSNHIARKRSLDVYKKVIQFASELESPVVQFHAGFALFDEDYDATWNRSRESLTYLASLAAGYGVTITMESASKIYTILNGSSFTKKMVEEVGSPNLTGMIDTLCLAFCDESIDTAIANIGPKELRHIHFSDCIAEDPANHLVPGVGTMNLDHIMEALSFINYPYYITLEMLEPNQYEPEDATRRGAEWLRARMVD